VAEIGNSIAGVRDKNMFFCKNKYIYIYGMQTKFYGHGKRN
jgi:hypothetical protein